MVTNENFRLSALLQSVFYVLKFMYTQHNISKRIMYSYRFMLPLSSYSPSPTFITFIMHKKDCHFSVVIVLSSEIKYDFCTGCYVIFRMLEKYYNLIEELRKRHLFSNKGCMMKAK